MKNESVVPALICHFPAIPTSWRRARILSQLSQEVERHTTCSVKFSICPQDTTITVASNSQYPNDVCFILRRVFPHHSSASPHFVSLSFQSNNPAHHSFRPLALFPSCWTFFYGPLDVSAAAVVFTPLVLSGCTSQALDLPCHRLAWTTKHQYSPELTCSTPHPLHHRCTFFSRSFFTSPGSHTKVNLPFFLYVYFLFERISEPHCV